MSREAFEEWYQRDLLDAPVHTSRSNKQWRAWQAARAAALEEAAEACESEAELWQEGVEARLCAARIRALKEKE